MALFPVGGQLLGAATQGVVARQAHHKRNGLKHQQKHGPENDVAVKPAKSMAPKSRQESSQQQREGNGEQQTKLAQLLGGG